MINLSKRITTLEVQRTRLGNEVVVAGFVEQTKLLGKMAFLKLRDREGYVQIVATSNYSKMKDLNTISRESVISIPRFVASISANISISILSGLKGITCPPSSPFIEIFVTVVPNSLILNSLKFSDSIKEDFEYRLITSCISP